METSELRIRNWVWGVSDRIEHIAELKKETVVTKTLLLDDDFETEYKYISPILLTEEWLLKFGFTKRTYSSGHPEYHIHPKGYHSNINCLLFEGKLRVSIINQTICTINYVHQLQNLYFALTGQELTIKQ